jgi:3',5'-cyclic AMP phosphodiesterase CpdA
MFLQKLNKKAILSLAIITIIAGTALAQKKIQDAPWFFIHLTDPQFGMFENNLGSKKETLLYEKAVSRINTLHPDLVVVTGDFVHDLNSVSQTNEFRRITAKINPEIPVYYTPGNHDIGQTPDKKSIRKFKKNYGSDKFSFKYKGSLLIGFNTSLIKAGLAKPERKQYNWLRRKLNTNKKADHTLLFCHYPFFNEKVDEPTAYSNIDQSYREKYLKLFKENKIDALFSGHLHNNRLLNDGQMELITTSALGKPLGNAPSGLRIVKIVGGKIEHAYFGLDELPDSVKFE